jgi:hypothetical protein
MLSQAVEPFGSCTAIITNLRLPGELKNLLQTLKKQMASSSLLILPVGRGPHRAAAGSARPQ